jgi:hypothetical protein
MGSPIVRAEIGFNLHNPADPLRAIHDMDEVLAYEVLGDEGRFPVVEGARQPLHLRWDPVFVREAQREPGASSA